MQKDEEYQCLDPRKASVAETAGTDVVHSDSSVPTGNGENAPGHAGCPLERTHTSVLAPLDVSDSLDVELSCGECGSESAL